MWYWLARWLIMPLLRRRIFRVIGWENLPSRGPLLLAANHNSWIDPALIISLLYSRLKQKIYFIAASGKYQAFGGLPIDRQNKTRVIDRALEILSRGGVVGIFPTGDAVEKSATNRAYTGAARLAHWSGVPVLPIGIINTSGTSPIAGSWEILTSQNVEIKFGAPVNYEKYSRNDTTHELLTNTTADIMRRVSQLSVKEP